MKSLMRSKKGVTLVELIVSISLFVVLIGGILAIFLTTNKTFQSGASQVSGKELCNEIYQEIENKLGTAESLTLKNGNFDGENIIAIDNKVMYNGANLVDYDSRLLHVKVAFHRVSEYVLGLQIEVVSPYNAPIYKENKSIKLNNMEIKGNKIYVQSEELVHYNGVDFVQYT